MRLGHGIFRETYVGIGHEVGEGIESESIVAICVGQCILWDMESENENVTLSLVRNY